MGNRLKDERHRYAPDPEVTRLAETLPAPGSGQSAEYLADLANKRKAALNRRSKDKRQQRVIQVDRALPGMAPSPFDPQQLKPKERHAQSLRAIERAQAAVDIAFDFTENLILAGTEAVTKIRNGKEVSEAESKLITDARYAANKLIDKTLPDIMAEGAKGGQVQINFGAPLARLLQTGPATIEIQSEEDNGSDQLHAAHVGNEDSRQPGED